MAERGIDISGEYPKPWTGEIIAAADVIVSMGCGDRVSALPGRRDEDWDLDDPAGKDVAEVRLIRDEIERRVASCSATCGFPTGPERGRRTEDVKVDGWYRMMC
jgi:arsenate reductase (thioredoxin)